MSDANKALVRRYYEEVLNGRKLDAVGNYFRNKLQTLGATEFIEKRDEVQNAAENYIQQYLSRYEVETRGVYIQDVVFPPDLVEVTLALGAEMLLLAGVERDRDAAHGRLADALASGQAAERFRSMVATQGGNPSVVEDPAVLPQAGEVAVHVAPQSGHVAAVEPRAIGRAITAMGGGRRTMEDVIDPSVGFVITAKPGDRVRAGEPLASIFARDAEGIRIGVRALEQAIAIVEEEPPAPLPLISHRVTSEGLEMLVDKADKSDKRIERIGG